MLTMHSVVAEDLPVINAFGTHGDVITAYTQSQSMHLDHDPQIQHFDAQDTDLGDNLSKFSNTSSNKADATMCNSYENFNNSAFQGGIDNQGEWVGKIGIVM